MPIFQQPFLQGGFPSMNRAAGAIGGWVELGRATRSGVGNLDVSSLADKRYYMFLLHATGSATAADNVDLRFNADTGSNYAMRYSDSGAADGTSTSTSLMNIMTDGDADIDEEAFLVGYIANRAANEKLLMSWYTHQNAAGAATAPKRGENVDKWANTTDAIDQITAIDNFGDGDEMVILGWDPDDTHTNNFWEELASVELGANGDNLSSGTITAKKYLWVQAWIKSDTSSVTANVTFNNDTASNYNLRYSTNGAADATTGAVANLNTAIGGDNTTGIFHNMFIINNQSNEKLVIAHAVAAETAGASNAPSRGETVGKWANTSNQITEIDYTNSTASRDYAAGSIMKVWGAD